MTAERLGIGGCVCVYSHLLRIGGLNNRLYRIHEKRYGPVQHLKSITRNFAWLHDSNAP